MLTKCTGAKKGTGAIRFSLCPAPILFGAASRNFILLVSAYCRHAPQLGPEPSSCGVGAARWAAAYYTGRSYFFHSSRAISLFLRSIVFFGRHSLISSNDHFCICCEKNMTYLPTPWKKSERTK